MTCPGTEQIPEGMILCHGWRLLGANIVAAFINLGLRCSDSAGSDVQGERVPSDEDLRSPGGATLDDLARTASQDAEEIYNEFDFTEPLTHDCDVVTLSYGERIWSCEALSFELAVQRAERLARSYYGLLASFGEISAQPFRIRYREWFLASPSLVTVHICFES